jgi:poly(3-hydroxybutyrate) depolymerase
VGRGEASGLEYATLDVAGVRRGYWLARGPGGPSGTLLVMLHGSGTSGKDVATIFTRLATRGPAAGVTVVFPDGWHGMCPPPSGRDRHPAENDLRGFSARCIR